MLIANAIAAGVTRPLNWLHLPVPRERTDTAYFEPLRNLQVHPETELYLGLIHYTDGVAGTQRRIAAARFREGRVFLAGDAAHEMSPAGGFGMNTGLQDAHNLAWKLSAVLIGWAGPALLESYQREREPVDRWITEQTLRNLASIRRIDTGASEKDISMHEGRREFFHERGLIFGATYESATVLPDGTTPPGVANQVTDYTPTAHPGCRAPHVWLEHAGHRPSTLDLFGTGLVLLAGRTGTSWCQAAAEVARARCAPLYAFTIGPEGDLVDPEGSWATTYGVEQEGAVLVRPDGHVAWRCRSGSTNPAQVLQRVLTNVLGESVASVELTIS